MGAPGAPVPGTGDAPEQRQVLRTLVSAQVLSGAGLAAGVTVGALLAREMLGSEGLAGVPSALFTIGSAGAALIVGRISDQRGRRNGLGFGYLSGAIGATTVVLAAWLDSVWLLLPALLVYGAGSATNLQARYAGADLAAPDRRARAISTVLVATTLGAVLGPNTVTPMGNFAESLGLPDLAGPFILAATAYGLAGVVLLTRLRPDPLLLARERALGPAGGGAESRDTAETGSEHPRNMLRAAASGAVVMVTAQVVMVAIMTMTPVHMEDHGLGLGATGLVIGVHIAGMYLPSPLTGHLVDRVGPTPVAVASAVVLTFAGVLAATVPGDSIAGIAVALAVLGIGWNLGLLSGTAMVTAAVPLEHRARTQGSVDVFVALAGATGGIGSGAVVAFTSYSALGLIGAAIAVGGLTSLALRQERVA
ncbi:MAG: MFS transporter [Microthrixaceae bacterium]